MELDCEQRPVKTNRIQHSTFNMMKFYAKNISFIVNIMKALSRRSGIY